MVESESTANIPFSKNKESVPRRNNRHNGNEAIDNAASQEILRLVQAMMDGRLSERGQVESFSGSSAELIGLVNRMLDALVSPLQVAAHSIDQIAHGNLPDFIIDEYKGEFNDIKRNLNTFLAIMYGMHHETQNLIQAIEQGKLGTRGNDWDFDGNWRQLIGGVNNTLDAVLTPIQEASTVLGQMSNYDLTCRVKGTYKGEHARIKKALNTTAEALQSALSQVAEAVTSFTVLCGEIAKSSEELAQGAAAQAESIKETSRRMEHIAAMAKQNRDNTAQATVIARTAKESVALSKDSAAGLAGAMSDIRASAEGTSVVIQEINTIAFTTDSLAVDAAVKAANVGSAGRGFSVLAKEMSDLAGRSLAAVAKMDEIIKSATGDAKDSNAELLQKELKDSIREINVMARQTNYLAMNAAVQAAHIEETGRGFELFTEEIRRLSVSTKDAALKTEDLIRRSVELAQNGENLARDIDGSLIEVVEGVTGLADIVERIATASSEQTEGVEAVNLSLSRIEQVTEQFAATAGKSFSAARTLEGQAVDLKAMVGRFQLSTFAEAHDELPDRDRQAPSGRITPIAEIQHA